MRGRIEFEDDGGTPMWRRRQAEIVVDARPKRLTFGQAAGLILFVGFALPFLIIFGGLAIAGLMDAITR
jgi:hypothetical protein